MRPRCVASLDEVLRTARNAHSDVTSQSQSQSQFSQPQSQSQQSSSGLFRSQGFIQSQISESLSSNAYIEGMISEKRYNEMCKGFLRITESIDELNKKIEYVVEKQNSIETLVHKIIENRQSYSNESVSSVCRFCSSQMQQLPNEFQTVILSDKTNVDNDGFLSMSEYLKHKSCESKLDIEVARSVALHHSTDDFLFDDVDTDAETVYNSQQTIKSKRQKCQ